MFFQSKWFPSFLFTSGTQKNHSRSSPPAHLPVTSFLPLACWLVSPLLFPSINICCTKANRVNWTGKYHRASSMSDLLFFYALALMTLILCLWCSSSSFIFAVFKWCCFWKPFWLFCCPYTVPHYVTTHCFLDFPAIIYSSSSSPFSWVQACTFMLQ